MLCAIVKVSTLEHIWNIFLYLRPAFGGTEHSQCE